MQYLAGAECGGMDDISYKSLCVLRRQPQGAEREPQLGR